MKKLLLISLFCVVMMFSACNNTGNTNETEITEWKPTATAEVKKSKAGLVNIVEEQVEVDEKSYPNVEASEVTETESTQPTEETTEVPTQGVANPKGHIPVTTVMGSFASADADFIYQDATIKPGDNIENIFKKIGEDNVSQEITETEWMYTYKDFVLYTYIDEENNEILIKVEPLNKNLPTSKGVKVGDYASGLVRIYGNPTKQENGTKYYEKDKKQLIFKYENNLITEIIYAYAK